jgi:hypothetical protein
MLVVVILYRVVVIVNDSGNKSLEGQQMNHDGKAGAGHHSTCLLKIPTPRRSQKLKELVF